MQLGWKTQIFLQAYIIFMNIILLIHQLFRNEHYRKCFSDKAAPTFVLFFSFTEVSSHEYATK